MGGLLKKRELNSKKPGEKMKKITAYIQPFMLQKITDALHRIHIRGMSISEIKGFGKEKDGAYPHHSRDYVVEFVPKVKIEIICADEEVDSIIETIRKNARTGRRGDGKIFVANIEKAVSVLTGEMQDKAI